MATSASGGDSDNFMQFAFILSRPPTPRQLCDLVTLDKDSVYVVSPDLSSGIGLDLYEGESKAGIRYEVDLWFRNIPAKL